MIHETPRFKVPSGNLCTVYRVECPKRFLEECVNFPLAPRQKASKTQTGVTVTLLGSSLQVQACGWTHSVARPAGLFGGHHGANDPDVRGKFSRSYLVKTCWSVADDMLMTFPVLFSYALIGRV